MDLHDFDLGYSGVTVTARRYSWLPGMENPSLEGARLRVEITETQGNIPKELFVWEQHILFNDTDTKAKDRFLCVAKVSDLSTYPVSAPDTSSNLPPFYRLAYMDIVIPSPADFALTWNDVQLDISSLVKSLIQLGLYAEVYGG